MSFLCQLHLSFPFIHSSFALFDAFIVLDYWNGRCFRCLDRLLVIPKKQLCDGRFHCKDLSDECLCELNNPKICNQLCLSKLRKPKMVTASFEII